MATVPTIGTKVVRKPPSSRYSFPFVPAAVVRRDRLLTLLDAAAMKRLTLVVAPPGYGKSMLLAQWSRSHRRRVIAWLTLGPDDNDATRFARHLCEALDRADAISSSRPLTLLERDGRRMGPAFVDSLLDELQQQPDVVVMIDDFHLLTNTAVLAEVGSLLDRAPRALHVVVAARADPPLQYHRLRLHDEVTELRQADLAFSTEEAGSMLANMGCSLDHREIGVLVDRTEGWAAALQFAAVSLRSSADPAAFVSSFAGDDRYVADYLAEQVLRTQPPAVRSFLLRTSVLDRMTASLCDHVTGGTNAQVMLAGLERELMFVTAIDHRREWFRSHRLFRSLLRRYLQSEEPGMEPVLLERAAAWYALRGDVDEQIHYLTEAGAWERALELATDHAAEMQLAGRAGDVARWIAAVPPEHRAGRVPTMLLDSAARALAGDIVAAMDVLVTIDDEHTLTDGQTVVAELIRAFCSLEMGDSAAALDAVDRVRQGLETVVPTDIPAVLGLSSTPGAVLSMARLVEGQAHLFDGRLDEARSVLADVLDGTSPQWETAALGSLALIDAWSGRLTAATERGGQALAFAEDAGLSDHPCAVEARLALAHVARRRGLADTAEGLLRDAETRIRPARISSLRSLLLDERAMLTITTDEPRHGIALLEADRAGALSPRAPLLVERRRSTYALLLLSVADEDRARRALDGPPAATTCETFPALMRLALERGDVAAARIHLSRWPHGPEPECRLTRRMWEAVLAYHEGDFPSSGRLLADVVTEREAESDLGPFLDAGYHIRGPARELLRTTPTHFLRTIVEHPATAPSPDAQPLKGLAQQLTDRERVVLLCLPTRMSNTEIADRLGVSLNTVKTHVKHIYRKLDVAGRSEAVRVAERLGLL